uniref:Vomeronasal type-1 receptor n=1 Tax=Cacopsylla melanoneura TaxID=428564 RepID=A0A8D8Z7M6_9HEMI
MKFIFYLHLLPSNLCFMLSTLDILCNKRSSLSEPGLYARKTISRRILKILCELPTQQILTFIYSHSMPNLVEFENVYSVYCWSDTEKSTKITQFFTHYAVHTIFSALQIWIHTTYPNWSIQHTKNAELHHDTGTIRPFLVRDTHKEKLKFNPAHSGLNSIHVKYKVELTQ